MEVIKVLLVDDHDILMDGIESLLNEFPKVKVVGKASSALTAESMVASILPHLVITDISMGDRSGLDLARALSERFPLIKVIVLTMHEDVQFISSMLEAGASGYLLKNVKQEELFNAIEKVMAGDQYIQQSLSLPYVKAMQKKKEAEEKSPLSPREIEIIRLIAKDYTSSEISKKLFLSEHTIDTHRKNIARKTGTRSVLSLVKYAEENGLL